jgi:hypothetical protein
MRVFPSRKAPLSHMATFNDLAGRIRRIRGCLKNLVIKKDWMEQREYKNFNIETHRKRLLKS